MTAVEEVRGVGDGDVFRHRSGRVELAGYAWRVEGARATVVLAHGVNEYLGRYGGIVAALTGAGFAVVGHDHRGHGRSEGRRGYVADFDDYTRDVKALIARERGVSPNGKVVLLGHSMGGLIAARAALLMARQDGRGGRVPSPIPVEGGVRRTGTSAATLSERDDEQGPGVGSQGDLAGLVLSAPALRIGHGLPRWQRRVFLEAARFLGGMPAPAGRPGHLSRDPAVEKAFGRDPLNNHERTRLRLARQIALAGEDTLARAGELRVPLLVMHGEADTVTDPAASAELVAAAGSADATFKGWPEGRHEIFNDLDKAEVTAYLLGWLAERFPV